MKKEAWFQFPESIAAQRQGEALHQLMQENFAHLAIVAILSGLAVTGTLVLTGAAPAWLAILPLTAVAILSLALRRSRSLWPAWPQRLLLVILTWILTGAILLPAWTSGQQTTSWAVFLLAILACAALTTRPLADHLASLGVPALVAGVRILVPAVSHESLGLALALAQSRSQYQLLEAQYQIGQDLVNRLMIEKSSLENEIKNQKQRWELQREAMTTRFQSVLNSQNEFLKKLQENFDASVRYMENLTETGLRGFGEEDR